MVPAVPETPEGVNVIRLGVLKLARLKRLKISARWCPRAVRICEFSLVIHIPPSEVDRLVFRTRAKTMPQRTLSCAG